MEQQAQYGRDVFKAINGTEYPVKDAMVKDQIKFELYLGLTMNLPGGLKQDAPNDGIQNFITSVAEPSLEGLSTYYVNGYWEGQREDTLIIVHIGPDSHRKRVQEVGRIFKRQFLQKEVMLVETVVSVETI